MMVKLGLVWSKCYLRWHCLSQMKKFWYLIFVIQRKMMVELGIIWCCCYFRWSYLSHM